MMTDYDLPEFQAALQMCIGVWEELCSKQNKVKRAPGVTCRAVVRFPGKQQCKERDEGSSSRTKTEAFLLPEELVEKIVCSMPFPHILKARVLNQSWKVRFSVNPEAPREALVFRNQVKAISSKWKHYCPTILNLQKGGLVGYDRQCNQWQYIPLTFDGKCFERDFKTRCFALKLKGAGSLMCGVWQSRLVNEIDVPYLSTDVFVTNIVTGSWKYLPTLRGTGNLVDFHLLTAGADAYGVFVITESRNFSHIYFHIYGSRTRYSWTTSQPQRYMGISAFFSSALLRGHLYLMGISGCHIDIRSYWHEKDGTLKSLPRMVESPDEFFDRNHRLSDAVQTGALLICQNQVMVVLTGATQLPPRFLVYILDQVTLDMTAVAEGPPWWIGDSCRLLASDNDRIYFGNPDDAGTSMLQLNLLTHKWSCLSPPPPHCAGHDRSYKSECSAFSLEPGINPFIPV